MQQRPSAFDPQSAPQEVKKLLVEYIQLAYTNQGNNYGGGAPAVKFDYKANLTRLGYSESYATEAIDYADRIGDEKWQRENGGQ